jgi:hypothetical protein
VNNYGTTETRVRQFDESGRLVSEQITTVTEKRIIAGPAGFGPVPVIAAPSTPAPKDGQ